MNLKKDFEQSVVCAVDEDVVKTDASDFAIAASSLIFTYFAGTRIYNHASVEKEVKAIIKAVWH